jgi:hypothetical protein
LGDQAGKSGAMGVPTIGGEFFDTEPSGPNGRSILCRFVWTNTNLYLYESQM